MPPLRSIQTEQTEGLPDVGDVEHVYSPLRLATSVIGPLPCCYRSSGLIEKHFSFVSGGLHLIASAAVVLEDRVCSVGDVMAYLPVGS